MKTITLISTLVCCWGVTAAAQGVHLNAGDTFSFGFDGVDGCHFTEGAPGSYVFLGLGNDILTPGESLRLELFENTLNDPSFASQTYSPATSITGVNLYGPTAWLDYQGVIRVTMISGSVDVLGARFLVAPNPNTFCDTTVAVPEPSACALLGLVFVISARKWISGLLTAKSQ